MDNRITFTARYDLSDKAKLFSKAKRAELKKIAKNLGANDVICIGTRNTGIVNSQTGKSSIGKEVRLDYVINHSKSSLTLDERLLNSVLVSDMPKSIKDSHFRAKAFYYIVNVLEQIQPYKSRKKHYRTFFEKMQSFEEMHNTKLAVRQWSRVKEPNSKYPVLSKLRNNAYKVKDYFTDALEKVVTTLDL